MSSGGKDFIDSFKAEKDKQTSQIPSSETKLSFTTSHSLGGIGILIDRWANLFPNMGEKTAEVQANIFSELKTRRMPATTLLPVKAYTGAMSQFISMVGGGWERPYIIATADPGVVCAVYIGKYGTDLYASWRTHVKGVVNRRLLLLIALVCIVPSLCTSVFASFIGGVTQITSASSGNIIGGLLGLITTPSTSSGYNSYTSNNGASQFFGSLVALILPFVFIYATALLLVALAGYFLQGDILHYFFIEPNIFNAEDITALSAAVHQSVLTAIDKAGIDVSKVEPKKFQSGRRSDRI